MKLSIERIVLYTFIFFIIQQSVAQESNSKLHPNILVVLIDDLGFHDISEYGSKIYETPQIDRLIGESYSFENAYAAYPRCLPSRFAMMTATYPVQEFNSDLSTTSQGDNFIKKFKNEGYDTYYIGKWHIGEKGNEPIDFGFDNSYAASGAGGTGSHFYPFNTRKNAINPLGKVIPSIPDVEEDGNNGDYLFDLMTDELIHYIKNRDVSQPFFTIFSPYSVHTPFEAKAEDIEVNRKQIENFDFSNTPEYIKEGNGQTKMRQDNPVYAAMVENTDWNLGRILDAIKDAGIEDNTIVVFTSDHGGLSNSGSLNRKLATTNYPLRAGKGHLYEGGVRVPLMIKWPQYLNHKKDNKSIVSLMDLIPTLLDISIKENLEDVDGLSFKNVMNGKEMWDQRDFFFYEKMARPNATGDFPAIAMRSGKYKLIHFYNTDTYELYDLSKDESEQFNLIDKDESLSKSLIDKINKWEKQYINNKKTV